MKQGVPILVRHFRYVAQRKRRYERDIDPALRENPDTANVEASPARVQALHRHRNAAQKALAAIVEIDAQLATLLANEAEALASEMQQGDTGNDAARESWAWRQKANARVVELTHFRRR